MSSNRTRQDVFDAIDADERNWNALLNAVGPEYMELPGAMGDWTFKDLTAHVNGWRAASLNRLEGKLTGDQPADPWPSSIDYEDYDRVNDWLYQQNRDRSIEDVMAETGRTYDRMRSLVRRIPDDTLFSSDWAQDTVSYGDSIIDREFFSHFPEEHEVDVKPWLESLGHQYPEPA